MTTIDLPTAALVVLIGASGSGKSSFAARWFRPTEILSSDAFRAIVADDPADQRATADAFELLHIAARARLRRGRLTVVDATNVTTEARESLLALAAAAGRPAVAIVFDLPAQLCHAWNGSRPERTVGRRVVDRQLASLRRSLRDGSLQAEGWSASYTLRDPVALDGVVVSLRR